MLRHWLPVALLRALVRTARILPYRARIGFLARLIAGVVHLAPSARQRIGDNLARTGFDPAPLDPRQFKKAVIRNFAQNLAELFNLEDFGARQGRFHPQGQGLELLQARLSQGQAAIIISGHLGQWEAIRAWSAAQSRPLGVIYEENSNPYYEALMAEIYAYHGPAFKTGVRGMAGFVRMLRAGQMIALLHDQRIYDADEFSFLGVAARTSTATASMALKYQVPIIPVYAIRRDNRYDYDIIVEQPIAADTPARMTQAMNDNLEKFLRRYPTQWYWFHQRWKKRERPRKRG